MSDEPRDDTLENDVQENPDDGFDDAISLPDIPMPEVVEDKTIQDTFAGAVKFCVIGSGQGGSRIAETFWDIGYKRVCVVNSTTKDLTPIKMPEDRKLVVGNSEDKGAGKDLELGKKYTKQSYEDVLDLMRRSFDTEFDRIMITVGAGGGTGAGSAEVLVDVAHEWAQSCGAEKPDGQTKVGMILALPQRSEGVRPSRNAYVVLEKMLKLQMEGKISPLVVIDNQRIDDVFPNVTVDKFWNVANQSICSLFHLFNLLAAKDSSYTSFDRADYDDILSSGVVSFGATPMKEPKTHTDISAAIRQNLSNNILSSGFELKDATKAGCVFVASKGLLSTIPQAWFNHGFEMLTRMIGEDSVVHRGIYRGAMESLAAYTIIGGLPVPHERLKALALDGKHGMGTVDSGDGLVSGH